jgi:hypothetical protein
VLGGGTNGRANGRGNLPRARHHFGASDLERPVEPVELTRIPQQGRVALRAHGADDGRHSPVRGWIPEARRREQRADSAPICRLHDPHAFTAPTTNHQPPTTN